MEHFLYLSVNLFSIVLPLLFSFHPRLRFVQCWKHFGWSMSSIAVLFLLWDAWFTSMGVWGFHERYLVGIYVGPLPLEEILFFICIPYASVFTYACISLLTWLRPSNELLLSSLLALCLLVIGIMYWDRWYTSLTFLALACFLFVHVVYFQFTWMRHFYLSYLAILPFFFLTNGILTGYFTEQPVVWYNDRENVGIRLGSIPVEDLFYGMLLLMLNVCLFEQGKGRKITTRP